jgi:formylglycine-generating enzyme required for sulfatase activity/serine/threonine protein kinase
VALNPGDSLLNGQYRIQRLLGRGGFGFVYQARDTLLDRDVAIKELISGLVGDEAMLKRFLVEARATMELTHEHIVRTHNVFQEGDNYYIVMECMAGGSLEERLRERGPLPVDEAVQVAAEVCEGLDYAHGHGVVHCDLKPHNILFDAAGQAKVADFGIAHVSGEMLSRSWMTPAGFVAGTLPYMSPEQADGVRDDPRVDIYALGAVLYRMLTGRLYLEFDQRETPGATADNVLRIRNQHPVPPSAHNARIPRWVDWVVLRALAKRPGDRFHTAMELRAALAEPAARLKPTPAGQPAPTHQPPAEEAPSQLVGLAPSRMERVRRAAPRPPPELKARQAQPVPGPVSQGPSIEQTRRKRSGRLRGLAAVGLLVVAIPVLLFIGVLISRFYYSRHYLRPGGTPAPTVRQAAVVELTTTWEATPIGASVSPKSAPTSPVDTRMRSTDGMTMVYVPAGEFSMGSTNADSDAYDDEKPQHTVTLDAFWIDKTEVTNAQYGECVEAGACPAPSQSSSYTRSSYYGNSSFDDYPVLFVGWNQASDYCRWVGARLPTEAEWEKAARGTDGRKYPWGNGVPDCNEANYWGKEDGCVGDTSQVGSYPAGASPYGALDMAGNVWEWVADWYDSDYYAISPGRNPRGPDSGSTRVLRGGSWFSIQRHVRAAYRRSYVPSYAYHHVGIRCARSISEP